MSQQMNDRQQNDYELLVDAIWQLQEHRPKTILADPPWQFVNRTGKMAPEHRRLSRYSTLSLAHIKSLPVSEVVSSKAHLYLWVPNALLPQGLEVLKAWGFEYKSNIVWYKIRKDGGPDRRGVGFYFRNVTEIVLFGVRGSANRTKKRGRTQPNIVVSRKREHSRKPDELHDVIEGCSRPPRVELFARYSRENWLCVGNEVDNPGARVFPTYRGHDEESLFGNGTSISVAATSPL